MYGNASPSCNVSCLAATSGMPRTWRIAGFRASNSGTDHAKAAGKRVNKHGLHNYSLDASALPSQEMMHTEISTDFDKSEFRFFASQRPITSCSVGFEQVCSQRSDLKPLYSGHWQRAGQS